MLVILIGNAIGTDNKLGIVEKDIELFARFPNEIILVIYTFEKTLEIIYDLSALKILTVTYGGGVEVKV